MNHLIENIPLNEGDSSSLLKEQNDSELHMPE